MDLANERTVQANGVERNIDLGRVVALFAFAACSIIAILAGYLIAAAIPKSPDGANFVARFALIVANPSGRFNGYTPICMAVGFLINEAAFGLAFISTHRNMGADETINRPVESSNGDEFRRKVTETEYKELHENLLARGYDDEQALEMARMCDYIGNVGDKVLSETFGVDASPDEIREYVELFATLETGSESEEWGTGN